MSTLPATPADDGFERHYAEKIWALVPETYRNEDGLAARRDVGVRRDHCPGRDDVRSVPGRQLVRTRPS